MRLVVQPKNSLRGTIRVPGDKSISHRSIMFGALAQGTTTVKGFLRGADCLSTVACFKALGVEIEDLGETILVHGKGLQGLQEPKDILDAGNSGTTTRLMLGILAGQKFYSVITGDPSIRKRPMGRVTKPLAQMGAKIYGRNDNTLAPLTVVPSTLAPIEYELPIASAQVKSAVLLAGLYADGITVVREPEKSRDHTERMLKGFGAELEVDGLAVKVKGGPKLEGQEIIVPGDISSAAFFLVAGAITKGSEIVIENVGLNPTRTGIIDILQTMGANLEILNQKEVAGEPIGDLRIKESNLKGITIGGEIIPRLIDEIPILAVAAAAAQGETIIKDAQELRVKETDRIKVMVEQLRKMGAEVEEREDGMIIQGGKPLKGALCHSSHDHRIAMSMAVAALIAQGETIIEEAQYIDISFPDFAGILDKL